MDEPLSNLDAKLRTQTRLELVDLHRRLGTTFVYVTHDQVEAMTMADRIAVINEGRIQQVGAPQDVYETPANLFVASFIGSPPMNTIGGILQGASNTAAASVLTAEGTLSIGHVGSAVVGSELVLGIRPEHLHLSDPTTAPGALNATIQNIELLGHERHVICSAGSTLMTVRQTNDAPHVAIGQAVSIHADPSGVHLFDPISTGRLN
jgi:multiple sugar transport system ATP-binding protein